MAENQLLGREEWEKAEAHLKEVRQQYTDIGAAGVPALTITINPLLVRLERCERTNALHDEIMALE